VGVVTVRDPRGRTIEVGSLVSADEDEAGVVRAIKEWDEGCAPRVVVEWEDGTEEEFQVEDVRGWYTEAEDLRVDDLWVVTP